MPIAKEQLFVGLTLAANPGNYIGEAAVKKHGWADKVDPDPKTTRKADEPKAPPKS